MLILYTVTRPHMYCICLSGYKLTILFWLCITYSLVRFIPETNFRDGQLFIDSKFDLNNELAIIIIIC